MFSGHNRPRYAFFLCLTLTVVPGCSRESTTPPESAANGQATFSGLEKVDDIGFRVSLRRLDSPAPATGFSGQYCMIDTIQDGGIAGAGGTGPQVLRCEGILIDVLNDSWLRGVGKRKSGTPFSV